MRDASEVDELSVQRQFSSHPELRRTQFWPSIVRHREIDENRGVARESPVGEVIDFRRFRVEA